MRLVGLVVFATACVVPDKELVEGPFRCSGQPLPSPVPAEITLSGVTDDGSGTQPVAGVDVRVFVAGDGAPAIATTTSGSGAFTGELATNSNPVTVYVDAKKPGFLDVRYNLSFPLTESTELPIAMFTANDLTTLSPDIQVAEGNVILVVVDCDGSRLSGATVTITPQQPVRYFKDGALSTTATATDQSGQAMIINISGGDFTLGATKNGTTLHSHTIQVIAGSITETDIVP